jgi:hypothetical protein
MTVSSSDAIMAVAKPDGELWYRNTAGTVVSGRPIAADETCVVFADNTSKSLREVSLYEHDVLHSI